MEQPYLALASGHTKSAAILVDCAKGILGAVEGAPFNPHSLKSEELSTQNLTLLVNELERVTGSSDLVNTSTRICLVAAGGAFEDDQTRVIDLLAHLPGCDLDPARVIVADDTWVNAVKDSDYLK